MNRYMEIENINQIETFNNTLASELQALSTGHEQRRINTIAVLHPNLVYFFPGGLWWSYRLYPVAPGVPTQYNNLFGYGRPGALGSKVEVNFCKNPVRRCRRCRHC